MSDVVFEPDVWQRAARDVDDVADSLQMAAQAGGQALPGGAFGLMCSPLLLGAYEALASIQESTLTSASEALHNNANDLRTAITLYQDSEDATVNNLHNTVPR